MAHYALLDENNVVTRVIVGRDEDDVAPGVTDWEDYYGAKHGPTCKRTSYNTVTNSHRRDGTPFRGNYAGIGFTYDEDRDAFIPPQPFPSWTLDDTLLEWMPPIPNPDEMAPYSWDEDSQSWVLPDDYTPDETP